MFEKVCVLKGKKLRENGASFRKKYDLILIFVTVVSRFPPAFVPIESGEKLKNKRYNRRVKRRRDRNEAITLRNLQAKGGRLP